MRMLGLAGFDDHELSHHPVVLVAEDVAVEHVWNRRVGVVAEGEDDPYRRSSERGHGVLPSGEMRRRRAAVDVENLEARVVRVVTASCGL